MSHMSILIASYRTFISRLLMAGAVVASALPTPSHALDSKPAAFVYKLQSLDASTGYSPRAKLIKGSDGNFYGTTYYGGAAGLGTLFKMDSRGTITTLHSFSACASDGCYPASALVEGADGALYGTTYYGGSAVIGNVFKISKSGTFSSIYSFTNCVSTGCYPKTALTLGTDGTLYGTTYYGGAIGLGTVFKVSTAGAVLQVYAFPNCSVACYPMDALTMGADGALYGASYYGGTYSLGSIFKLTTSGTASALYSFPNCTSGCSPRGGLTQSADGTFYGVTYAGGSSGLGTVYQFKSSAYTMLVAFNGTGGSLPQSAPLLLNGTLYGTTLTGGTNGLGAIYAVSTTSTGAMTKLYDFENVIRTAYSPAGGLVQVSGKRMFGMSASGGDNQQGAVYSVTPLQ